MNKMDDELLIETYLHALQISEIEFIILLKEELHRRGLEVHLLDTSSSKVENCQKISTN